MEGEHQPNSADSSPSSSSWRSGWLHPIFQKIRGPTTVDLPTNGNANGESPDLHDGKAWEIINTNTPAFEQYRDAKANVDHTDDEDDAVTNDNTSEPEISDEENTNDSESTDDSDGESVASAGPESSGTGMMAEIKQEITDEMLQDVDGDNGNIIDVDEDNVPIAMIRVPQEDWEKMLRAQRELDELRTSINGHDSPAIPTTHRRRPKKDQTAFKSPISRSKSRRRRKPWYTRKRFECLVCKRKYAKRSSLTTHELSHDKPKLEFSCHFCEKNNFKTAHHLRQHEACHNRCVPCEYCGRQFGLRAHLLSHQKLNKRCIEGRGHGPLASGGENIHAD